VRFGSVTERNWAKKGSEWIEWEIDECGCVTRAIQKNQRTNSIDAVLYFG